MQDAPNKQNQKSSLVVRTLGFTITAVILATAVLFVGPRVSDKILASSFSPSQRIATVNERIGLSDRGTELFYASKPVIENQEQFNRNCESTERTTAMLGCYYKRQMYLYDVQSQDLDGAVEVTAAHEMLHAAYERLNFFEKRTVDGLIAWEYERVKDDAVIKQLMEYYREAEPGADMNELHSIIGTTVEVISPDLEKYYQRYFEDRSSVVALNTQYNEVFRQVEVRADELSRVIAQEAAALESELGLYNIDRKQLETDIATFNARATSSGFSSQSSFNVARNALVARSSELEARRASINNRVNEHNVKVEELNALAVRAQELNKSINGIDTPQVSL